MYTIDYKLTSGEDMGLTWLPSLVGVENSVFFSMFSLVRSSGGIAKREHDHTQLFV